MRRGLGGGGEALEELGAGGLAAEGGGGEPRGRRGRSPLGGDLEGGVRYPRSHKCPSLGSLPGIREAAPSRGESSHEGTNCGLLLKNKDAFTFCNRIENQLNIIDSFCDDPYSQIK